MHDHVLVCLTYAWSKAELVIALRNQASEEYEAKYSGVRFLSVPHKSPWGESSSINNYSEEKIDSSEMQATIEMQSGDLIIFSYRVKF